uniref:tyrosine-type recombinase/integrase n=1 Tax=Acetatifactor sp. TaxID=1872090 RepID=UPI004056DE46
LRTCTVKNSTIRSYCRSVKAFLRYCYEEDLCKDYLKRVKLPKDDAAPKVPLYTDEVARIDATFDRTTEKGARNYCIVHLMLDCGLRRQEVVHLRPEHIDVERNILSIMDSKGNKSRFVLIPDFLLEAIDRYRGMKQLHSDYLFDSLLKVEPITDNSVKMLFQDLKKETGIERLHAHLLRHTFATSYLIGGGNLEFLRVFLGHFDYTVTKNYSSMAAQFKMLGADIYRLDSIFFTRGY